MTSTYSYPRPANCPLATAGDSTTVTVDAGNRHPSQVTQYSSSRRLRGASRGYPRSGRRPTPRPFSAIDSPYYRTEYQPTPIRTATPPTTALPSPPTLQAPTRRHRPPVDTDALGHAALYAYTASNEVWCEVEPGRSRQTASPARVPPPTIPPTAGASTRRTSERSSSPTTTSRAPDLRHRSHRPDNYDRPPIPRA